MSSDEDAEEEDAEEIQRYQPEDKSFLETIKESNSNESFSDSSGEFLSIKA